MTEGAPQRFADIREQKLAALEWRKRAEFCRAFSGQR